MKRAFPYILTVSAVALIFGFLAAPMIDMQCATLFKVRDGFADLERALGK